MNKQEISTLNVMRSKGKTAIEIASALNLSVNTVRSYIRRHPPKYTVQSYCRYCEKPVLQVSGRKVKLFCSDKCRNAWWKEHSETIKRKTYYRFTCDYCGKEFESYGNKNRKYCSRECYANSRKAH
ncbi:MAG: LuxR C-terminal-related transcriptional regulator [Eubacteriales bacterium]|nr:LuxR C-terminal-related transcriptional regulator [Eubacteriales bacterium]